MIDELALPEPSASTVDRIRYLIKLSRRTQAQFSRLIDVDPSNISKLLSGRIPVTDGLINRMVVNLGVSKDWLKYGTDVPFAKGEHVRTVASDDGSVSLSGNGAPVYDIDVTAGFGELSRMFTDERIIGRLDMPQINPECPIVRVSGDSMSPRINNGSFISIRPIGSGSPLFWGQIYVVVMEDYRMVKFVRRHPDPDMIILHSANPAYDDMEIPRRSVLQFYIVESILNYDIVG